MKTSFTIESIKKSACGKLNPHLDGPVKKKNKYSNKKCVIDELEFDSIKEANRYNELKILLKAGEIAFLKLQVPYELNEGGSHSYKYIADFVYTDLRTAKTIVEDVKGFRTAIYQKKKKLMLKVHGIEIHET